MARPLAPTELRGRGQGPGECSSLTALRACSCRSVPLFGSVRRAPASDTRHGPDARAGIVARRLTPACHAPPRHPNGCRGELRSARLRRRGNLRDANFHFGADSRRTGRRGGGDRRRTRPTQARLCRDPCLLRVRKVRKKVSKQGRGKAAPSDGRRFTRRSAVRKWRESARSATNAKGVRLTTRRPRLFQMRRQILVHLEHCCLVLAEDLLERAVGEDFALVLGFWRLCLRI